MRLSLFLSALSAFSTLTAPALSEFTGHAANPTTMDDVSKYFNTLAHRISEVKHMASAPVCDLKNAVLPTQRPIALPAVSAGLSLKHVAVGRGTQNYTCDLSNTTSAPTQVGAVATLYNASCLASTHPDLLDLLPRVSLVFNLTPSEAYPSELIPAYTNHRLLPGNYMISGHHYFTSTKTPFFDLDTSNWVLGRALCAKNASVAAPTDAPKGQGGEAAVPWLKLTAQKGATGRIQEVYRVETAGGSAPATCEGMEASFKVQYGAQ